MERSADAVRNYAQPTRYELASRLFFLHLKFVHSNQLFSCQGTKCKIIWWHVRARFSLRTLRDGIVGDAFRACLKIQLFLVRSGALTVLAPTGRPRGPKLSVLSKLILNRHPSKLWDWLLGSFITTYVPTRNWKCLFLQFISHLPLPRSGTSPKTSSRFISWNRNENLFKYFS